MGFYSAPGAPRGTGLQMELEALDFAFIDLSLQKLNCEVIATNKKVIDCIARQAFKTRVSSGTTTSMVTAT